MTATPNLHDLTEADAIPPALLKRTEADLSGFLERVKPIIEAVKNEGDAALKRFGRDFDKVTVPDFSIRVTETEFEEALAGVSPEVKAAIEFAIDNIRRFHEAQKPEEMWLKEVQPGAYAGDRFLPIESVACYVPRGKGSFPSVLMMTTIPGIVAGVPRLVVITPPGPDGKVDAGTLVAAKLVGVTEVYKCGGAQGVAAVAFGTETVPKCLKIVGPGSPWVVAAKRLLSDHIDPGVPAGPSECVVLADDSANGALAALDLIIESEHGPDSSAYLVTSSRAVAEAAREALPRYWAEMEEGRANFSRTVLTGPHGGIVLTRDFDAAVAFVNDYAPEHLEILAEEPLDVLGKIKNAGEILLGEHTPVTIGNFVLGPNAVLPTSAAAKTASPLSVFDYMKRSSVGYVTKAGYLALAKHAYNLARYEGFDGHARAVSDLRDKVRNG
ncbi:histidinol dehydrogenase [Faunimonas pinastri]|nr:histidinol dehydrogenase [Faunimonas pinastri]